MDHGKAEANTSILTEKNAMCVLRDMCGLVVDVHVASSAVLARFVSGLKDQTLLGLEERWRRDDRGADISGCHALYLH